MKARKRILAYLLTLTLIMTSLPTQLFAQTTNDLPLPISALVDTQTTTLGAIQINPAKYVGDGYEVEFKVTNQWSGAFNSLGYEKSVYITLENDILDQYEDKLYNYYYYRDIVGHSLGANPNGTYIRAGKQIGPWIAKDKYGVEIPVNKYIYELSKVHGIGLWHHDKNLNYPFINIIS